MWSKRDRVMAALAGERPDRPPVFECVCHDGVLEHFRGAPVAAGDFEAMVHACSRFLDLCHPALVPDAPRTIAHPDGSATVVERWTRWQTPGPEPGEAAMLKLLEEELEQAEAWRPSAGDLAAYRRRAGKANALAGDMVYINHSGGCPILPFNLERGFYIQADHPDLVKRWNRAVNAKELRWTAAVADAALSPVCILWCDIACKDRLLYPPAMLEALFFPHLQAQVEALHAAGVKVLFHSDGNVNEVLPRLAACGIDAFNPLEISAGMTPAHFIEACGRRVALAGGVDAVETLARGTPDQVRARTRALIRQFRDAGGLFVASSSGEIDNSMPTANVLAMYEEAWKGY